GRRKRVRIAGQIGDGRPVSGAVLATGSHDQTRTTERAGWTVELRDPAAVVADFIILEIENEVDGGDCLDSGTADGPGHQCLFTLDVLRLAGGRRVDDVEAFEAVIRNEIPMRGIGSAKSDVGFGVGSGTGSLIQQINATTAV